MATRNSASLSDYMSRCIGPKSPWYRLVMYEIWTLFFSNLRGATGLALRRTFHPLLLGKRSRGMVLGSDVVFRGIDRIVVGDGVKIDDYCLFDVFPAASGIKVGNLCSFERNCILSTGPMSAGAVTLGDEVSVGAGCQIFGHCGLRIGNKVMIGGMSYMVAGTHRYSDKHVPMREQGHEGIGIVIEDDVWIGSGCIILDGVRIGRGSVVGAGSVVTRSVHEGEIVAGVPARLLRRR